MLTASAYANKEKLTEATTFIEEHWLDIATAALIIYCMNSTQAAQFLTGLFCNFRCSVLRRRELYLDGTLLINIGLIRLKI